MLLAEQLVPLLILHRNGRELELFVPPGHPLTHYYLELFGVLVAREFMPEND